MSIKKEFASGVFFTSIAKYSGLIIQIGITVVLARLLTPTDFGIVAIATVLIQFFATISEAGIGPAVIQKKDLSNSELESIFSFTLIIGLLLSIIFFSLSYTIAKYYNNEALVNICKWLSLMILFNSANIVPNSLLLKQKKFKIIAFRTIIIQLITGSLSIYTAYIGWGMYALVLSAVSSSFFIFITNWFLNPLNLKYKWSCLKKISSYSVYQFGFNLVNYFSRNIDKILIGKYIGLSQLGYYEKSYRLMMLPLNNITSVLTPVVHPIFSELQEKKEEMLNKYLKLIKVMGLISFPAMTFLFFNAKELIYIFFGNQWEASVLPFKILSLTVALQVIHASSSGIYQAVNDTKGLFITSLISAIIMIIGFLLSSVYYKSIVAVSYSYLITCTFCSIFVFYILFKRFKVNFLEFFKTLSHPFFLGVTEFLILEVYSTLVPNLDNTISLFIKTLVIITVFISYIAIFKIQELMSIINIVRFKRHMN